MENKNPNGNRNNNQNQNGNRPPMQVGPRNLMPYILFLLIGIGVWMFLVNDIGNNGRTEIPPELDWNTFVTQVELGNITEVITRPVTGDNNHAMTRITGERPVLLIDGEEVDSETVVTFEFNDDGEPIFAFFDGLTIDGDGEHTLESAPFYVIVYTNVHIEMLTNLAMEYGLDVRPRPLAAMNWSLLLYIGVMVVLGGFFVTMLRSAQRGNNKAFNFGNNKAQLSKQDGVTFGDVAGNEEEKEELVEIVDFLKSPKKYQDMGARIPKGVLLTGPPGTGKTLLARAVAGEAGVPFYSISGSDFVEMFVGVGASRVRDMFAVAKKTSPCIIFIDEIDAVGRQRGTGMGGGHDEREQTLNQLLIEMDGFGANSGIVIIAATNRADVLDPALLRPGRFDRKVIIGLPDVKGREAVLKIHARNKKFESTVELGNVAKRTPGFSGADLENLLNEAALLAARDNRKVIGMPDIDEATDRVMMGPAKKSRVITPKERKTVAYHEAGHVVAGIKLKNASIVQKVTIIPRGSAGGYAMMLPEEETMLSSKSELLDRITGLLAGRVAEELTFGEITTGASHDFQEATRIARAMVTEFGMSKLGPIQFEQRGGDVFLGRDYTSAPARNFSDQLALKIDDAVAEIINDCYKLATETLIQHGQLMSLIAETLLVEETLTKEQIDELVEKGHLDKTNYGKGSLKSDDEIAEIKEEIQVLREEMVFSKD